MVKTIINDLKKLADPQRALSAEWFFKTGLGEYGEGDKFLGVSMPNIRAVARDHRDLDEVSLGSLLDDEYHEVRMLALVIMVYQFKKKTSTNRDELHWLYLEKARQGRINNWDLVDLSAKYLVGMYLENEDRELIHELADTGKLWLERISILATFWYLNRQDFEDSLILAVKFLPHDHDLIQKAVGWMLREIGKRDRKVEEEFLKEHYKVMPRTMLRYAIEKFPEKQRQDYLKGRV